MEANGYLARIVGLEKMFERHEKEQERQRSRIETNSTAQAVSASRLHDLENDQKEIKEQMRRLTRAFYAAAASFGALTLTGIGIIATLLGSN